MVDKQVIEAAKEHFGKVLEGQLERVERLKAVVEWTDFGNIRPIIIGILGGDGIGPAITAEAQHVLEYLLKEQVDSGKVEFRTIEGLTIENRAARKQNARNTVSADQTMPLISPIQKWLYRPETPSRTSTAATTSARRCGSEVRRAVGAMT